MHLQTKDAGEVERNQSQRHGAFLAGKAMEAAERLGLDPASEVEAIDRAGLTFCDPGAESPEADQLCRFIVESPGADLMSHALAARRRMLLVADGGDFGPEMGSYWGRLAVRSRHSNRPGDGLGMVGRGRGEN
jgi:hypothetical protein